MLILKKSKAKFFQKQNCIVCSSPYVHLGHQLVTVSSVMHQSSSSTTFSKKSVWAFSSGSNVVCVLLKGQYPF